VVLHRQLGEQRVRFDPSDRAWLAALLSSISKPALQNLRLLVRPDTILRWHRDVHARRHANASRPRRRGRPSTIRKIRALVLRRRCCAVESGQAATGPAGGKTKRHCPNRNVVGQHEPFRNSRSPSEHHRPTHWEIPLERRDAKRPPPTFPQVAALNLYDLDTEKGRKPFDP
jgi:hypothetical protein